MKATGFATIALAAAVTLACNNPRTDATNERDDANQVGTAGAGEREAANDFAQQAAVGGMAEIELGQMAQQKGQHPDVKAFGEMMVRDHTTSSNELKQIAASHSLTVPAQLDEKHAELRDRLSRLSGTEFDREYMNAMVQGHQDMADLMQTRASEDRFGDDRGQTRPEDADNPVEAALNQFAAKTLPVVRHHLEEAERVRDNVNGQNTTTRR